MFLFSHQYAYTHVMQFLLSKKAKKKRNCSKQVNSLEESLENLGEGFSLEDFEEPSTLISTKVMFLQRLCVCISSKIGFSSYFQCFFSPLVTTNDNNLLQFCNKIDFFHFVIGFLLLLLFCSPCNLYFFVVLDLCGINLCVGEQVLLQFRERNNIGQYGEFWKGPRKKGLPY